MNEKDRKKLNMSIAMAYNSGIAILGSSIQLFYNTVTIFSNARNK